MIWYGWIQSSAMLKQHDVRWCAFRLSIPLSIDYVWISSMDRAVATRSYSYCIWNRYCQNHRIILPNFLMIAWFDTPEFNRLSCSNNKMYYDAIFADRFRYQLIMFGFRVLVGLSRLLYAHIAYQIDTAKSSQHSSAFSIGSMIWYAWIQSSAMSNNKMHDVAVFADRFRYQLAMFGIQVLIVQSRLLHAHISYELDTSKIIAAFLRISYRLHDLIRLNSIVCHV